MTRLCDTVMRTKEDLHYQGRIPEGLPPAVHDALDDYILESQTKVLVATLLREPEEKESGEPGDPFGVLLAEQLKQTVPVEELAGKVEVIAPHAACALWNALTYRRIFLLPVWRAIGKGLRWLRGNRLAKAAVAAAGIVALTMFLILYPAELRLEGKGELLPEVRRNVYAPEQAKVARVLVDHGQLVKKGQLLLEMRSPELEQQRLDIWNQLQQAHSEFEYGIERSEEDFGATKSRAQARILSFERQLKLIDSRLESLRVKSPIDGMVATWDPKLTLRDRPVNTGDLLLEIWDVGREAPGKEVKWVLRVKMPEHRIGYVLEAARRREKEHPGKPLTALYILASYPERKLRGHVTRIYTAAELDKDEKEHVVPVYVVPDGVKSFRVIEAPMSGNPAARQVNSLRMIMEDGTEFLLSPGAEVRVKIECGKRALGFVMLRELIEFFYETILF